LNAILAGSKIGLQNYHLSSCSGRKNLTSQDSYLALFDSNSVTGKSQNYNDEYAG